ncbi:MAG TPA: Gfo/Idh/MocA family oxidoreductase [Terriglobales bacterium]|nr:Gfo/Idh/MocA family oxidoreductase [Terriglobales bacterium]
MMPEPRRTPTTAANSAPLALPRPPRLGFVGLGWIGRHRLRAVAESELAEIVALCDPSPACIDEARAIAPQAQPAAGIDELVDLDLDGLVIATPNALHQQQTIAALQRGIAVFCQKPLARTASETEQIVAAARAANRDLDVDLSYRQVRAMQVVRKTLQEHAIGKVFAAELIFHNAYGPDKPWFYQRELAGGGCVLDLGIHLIDLLLWGLGEPSVVSVDSRLFARGLRLGAEEVEDYATVQLDLGGEITARLACSWRLSAGCDAVIEASFYGTEGRVSLRNRNGSFYDFFAELARGTRCEVLFEQPDAWGGRAALAWLRRLQDGGRFRSESESLIRRAELIDRIYQRSSAEERR